MPFWKKAFSKRTGVYYPQVVVQGKPVETETIAKDLSKISTVLLSRQTSLFSYFL